MFKNFLKNKTFCFLMSFAAICPAANAKESSEKTVFPSSVKVENDSQKELETSLEKNSSHSLNDYAETIDINGADFYVQRLNAKEPKIQMKVGKIDPIKTQLLDVDGTKFLIPEQKEAEKTSVTETEQIEISTEIKEKNAAQARESLEKLNKETSSSNSHELIQDDLLDMLNSDTLNEQDTDKSKAVGEEASSQGPVVSQVDETPEISSEEKEKNAKEAKDLLEKLNDGTISSKPIIQSDLAEALSFDDNKKEETTSEESVPVIAKESNPEQKEGSSDTPSIPETSLTNQVASSISDVKPEISSNTTEKAENASEVVEQSEEEKPLPLAEIEQSSSINSSNSLASLTELINDVEGKKQEPQETSLSTRQKIERENENRKKEEKKKLIYGIGGVCLGSSLLLIPIFLYNPNKEKRVPRRGYWNDDVFASEILSEVIHNKNIHPNIPASINRPKVSIVKPKEIVEAKTENKPVPTVLPKSDIVKSEETVKNKIENETENKPLTDTATTDTSDENFFTYLYLLGMLEKAKEDDKQCADFWRSMKVIDEITDERAVLRRKMAAAKKQNNTEEMEAIKARRKILTSKRREACFRANSKEMLAIKEERRLLTKKMTIARRKNDIATMEKIIAVRFEIKNHLKAVAAEIKAFDYKKERRSFLDSFVLTKKQLQKTL